MEKNPREFELIVVQGHPRLSILVPIEKMRICNFLLLINSNFGHICCRFSRYWHI